MKLRLKGNSIRVRLDRRDIERLIDEGRVDDAVRFGPGLAFSYAVEVGPAPRERPTASYTAGRLLDPDRPRGCRGVARRRPRGLRPPAARRRGRRPRAPGEGLRLHRPTDSGKRRTTPTPSPTRRPFARAHHDWPRTTPGMRGRISLTPEAEGILDLPLRRAIARPIGEGIRASNEALALLD